MSPEEEVDSDTLFGATEQIPDRVSTARPIGEGELIGPAPGFGEVFSAGRAASRVDYATDFESQMLLDGYAPVIEALGLDGSQNPAGFFDSIETRNPMLRRSELLARQGGDFLGTMTTRPRQEELIAAEIRARRAKDPNFLKGIPDTVAGLRAHFAAQERDKRNRGLATLDRAEGVGGALAGLAGGFTEFIADPVNALSLPIGGAGGSIFRVVARETLVNGALETLAIPSMSGNRELIGEELTAGEAIANVGFAAVAGGVFEGVLTGAGRAGLAGYDKVLPVVFEAMPASVQRRWADKMTVGDVNLSDLLADVSNTELAAFSRNAIGDGMTPDEAAAVNVLERDEEVGDASPYQPGPAGDAAHEADLSEAIDAIEANRPPMPQGGAVVPSVPTPDAGRAPAVPSTTAGAARLDAEVTGGPAKIQFKAKVRRAESSGDDRADNTRSSAQGRYQFTDDTWKRYHNRVYGGDGMADKFDPAKQERLMDELTDDNAATLTRNGQSVTAGNLYLLHFFGEGNGPRVLRADPATPIERALDPKTAAKVMAANPHLKGMSASQAIAWAHKKMGGSASAVAARGPDGAIGASSEDPIVAQLRDEALRLDDAITAERPLAGGGRIPSLYRGTFRPGDITVDAARFQFKSGGDDRGVLDTLAGVDEWDPWSANPVILWQDKDGGIFLADGHQRHGLASRLEAKHGKPIELSANIMRESDGVTAEDARVYAALVNIRQGTGSIVDAAKVFRVAPELLERALPPKNPLVRHGLAISRLSDEAFGAVINDVVPADHAASIGRLVPDLPETHAALIKVLRDSEPANAAQAENIIRQALAAGMVKESQVDLFGADDVVTSLFKDRARVLERGLARLRKMKLVYRTAADEADTLEAAGSTIAREASAKEAQANAEAVELVNRLAFSHGPIADALTDASRKLAAGEKLADVVKEFVGIVRKLDLGALGRAVDGDGGDGGRLVDGGRNDDAFEEGPSLFGQSGDPGEPTLVEIEAATERFSDPDGPAMVEQADSLLHDFKAAIDFERLPDGEEQFADLSDRDVAEIFAAQTIDDAIDLAAMKSGRKLELGEGYDELLAELTEYALGDGAGEVDKLMKMIDKAMVDGRFKLEDLGEPELVGPVDMPPSSVVPAPAATIKAKDIAGDFIAPEEAKSRLDGWKAEALRIGRESPPPPGTVIISLFDASGRFSQPYRDMGYEVIQLDIKNGHDLIRGLGGYLDAIAELQARGGRVAGVLAQPPCTTFAGSGARWWDERHNRKWGNAVNKMWGPWATKFFDSPVEYNQFLVAATEQVIAKASPDFHVIENPVGRIEKATGLPAPLMRFDPNHFGDPYTKNTALYGQFNTDLQTAHVDPVEGSRMHKLRSSAEKDGGLRSLTSEPFAYAFALANRPGTDGPARAIAPPDPPPPADLPPPAAASRQASLLGGVAAVDPGIAARQAQEVELGAAAPLRAAGDVDQLGEIGLGLFDAVDQGSMTFRLDEEGTEISAADLLADLDADMKAIDALKGCL